MKCKYLFPIVAIIACIFPWGCDKELPDPNNNGNNNGNNNTTDTIYFTVEGIKLSNGVVKDTMHNSAKIVGDFSSIANTTNPIIEHGHVWSKTTNLPVLGNAEGFSSLGAKSSPGIFTSNLTGLTPNSVYYARAYVTTQQGTAYHPKFVQFKTKPNPTPNLVFGQFSIISDPNNNNSANPGETLTIDVSVLNSGLVDAKGVTAQFLPNAGVQVLSSQPVLYGDIFAGASISKSISIKVDQSVQWNSTIPFTINLKDNATAQWTSNFNLIVNSPYVVSENLLIYYTFENQSLFNISQIENVVENANKGSVFGALQLENDAPSNSGKSVYFPGGITNYYKMVGNPLSGAAQYSTSFWIKTSDSKFTIIDGRPTDYCTQSYTWLIENGFLEIAGEPLNFSINNVLINNLWHHIVFTKSSSGKFNLFVDGSLFDTKDISSWGDQNVFNGSTITFGKFEDATGCDYSFQGKFDNFRFYNRELTSNEVQQIFEAKQ